MTNSIVTVALHGAQLVFSVVVLGLSIDLINGHKFPGSDLPASLGYAAFVGATSLLGALIGIASEWVVLLQGIIIASIDVFVLLINFVGGVVFAYKLRGLDCFKTSLLYRYEKLNTNSLLNGGCGKVKGVGTVCWYWVSEDRRKTLNSRCKEGQADTVFMFLTVVVLIAAVTMTLLHRKR